MSLAYQEGYFEEEEAKKKGPAAENELTDDATRSESDSASEDQ